mgnify:FL=1
MIFITGPLYSGKRTFAQTLPGKRLSDVQVLAADAADLLVAYGPLSAAMAEAARQKGLQTIHCQAAEEVVEYLRQNVRPGDVVLAKASHAMKLDNVLKQLYAALPNA